MVGDQQGQRVREPYIKFPVTVLRAVDDKDEARVVVMLARGVECWALRQKATAEMEARLGEQTHQSRKAEGMVCTLASTHFQ
jgi:hypothetical protein